jgi:hypothetical protein
MVIKELAQLWNLGPVCLKTDLVGVLASILISVNLRVLTVLSLQEFLTSTGLPSKDNLEKQLLTSSIGAFIDFSHSPFKS